MATGTHRVLIEAIKSGKAQIIESGTSPDTEVSVSAPCDYVEDEGDEPENEDDAKVAEEFDRLRLEDAAISWRSWRPGRFPGPR